ncbi:MAG: 30S ribosomal protein S21 [Xenococcaceae cyanobacterium]
MTQVFVGRNEGIESALRRFKRQVSKAGIFPDMKKHRHFETPIEKRKRKEIARHRQRRKLSRYGRKSFSMKP